MKGGQDKQKFTLKVISFDDQVSPSPGIQTPPFSCPHPPSTPDTPAWAVCTVPTPVQQVLKATSNRAETFILCSSLSSGSSCCLSFLRASFLPFSVVLNFYPYCIICTVLHEAHHWMSSKGLKDKEESVALLLVGLAIFYSSIPKKSCIPSCPGKLHLGIKGHTASPGLQGASVTRTGYDFAADEPWIIWGSWASPSLLYPC